MCYLICIFLLGITAVTNFMFAGRLVDELSLSFTSAIGGLSSKNENKGFAKYKNNPLYVSFFSQNVTNDAREIYDAYKKLLKDWPTSYALHNKNIPNLNATEDQPLVFARMYNFMVYIADEKSSFPIQADARNYIKSEILDGYAMENGKYKLSPSGKPILVKKCSPLNTISLDASVNEKDIQYGPYLFLSAECSKKIIDFLNKQSANLASFFGYAFKPERTRIGKIREKCEKAVTPDCSILIRELYQASEKRPYVAMLLGKGLEYSRIVISPELNKQLYPCSQDSLFAQNMGVCTQTIQSLLSVWNRLDRKEDPDLYPDPVVYMEKNGAGDAISFEERKRAIEFESFESYKDMISVFREVYGIATVLDTTFRIRVSHESDGEFIFLKQEAALRNELKEKQSSEELQKDQSVFAKAKQTIAQKAKDGVNFIAKEALVDKDPDESTDGAILPLKSLFYIKNLNDIMTKMVTVVSKNKEGEQKKVIDLLVGSEPFDVEKYPDVKIEVDEAKILTVLAKICMSILGPEYLKAESMLEKALEEQDQAALQETLKQVSVDLNEKSSEQGESGGTLSEKGAKGFKNIPTAEYNKLRQVALALLTSIHVLLLDEMDQRKGQQGSFFIVAKQVRALFSQQITFFARYIFSIKTGSYCSSDLSTSFFTETFSKIFLEPFYPLVVNKIPNQSTLIDPQGGNLYSLFSIYLLGSIQGIPEITDQHNILMENRHEGRRLLGNLSKEQGGKTTLEFWTEGALKAMYNALPIPHPPLFGSVMALLGRIAIHSTVGKVFEKMKESCMFNKDKCPKNIKDIRFNKTLVMHVTEFLIAMKTSLKGFFDKSGQAIDQKSLDRLMPTLYIMTQDDLKDKNETVGDIHDQRVVEKSSSPSSIDALLSLMISNTRNYYKTTFETPLEVPQIPEDKISLIIPKYDDLTSLQPNHSMIRLRSQSNMEKSARMTPQLNIENSTRGTPQPSVVLAPSVNIPNSVSNDSFGSDSSASSSVGSIGNGSFDNNSFDADSKLKKIPSVILPQSAAHAIKNGGQQIQAPNNLIPVS
ncbi:MAG: hypothetical protein HEEMFOPI_01176 [Holosporales bacterium]